MNDVIIYNFIISEASSYQVKLLASILWVIHALQEFHVTH